MVMGKVGYFARVWYEEFLVVRDSSRAMSVASPLGEKAHSV